MNKIGIVKKIEDNFVIVEVERLDACKQCGGCINSGSKKIEVKAKNSIPVDKNDKVGIAIKDLNIFGMSFFIYIIPLLFFLIGLVGGYIIYPYFFQNDVYQSIFSAGAGLILMLSGWFVFLKQFKFLSRCNIEVVKKIS